MENVHKPSTSIRKWDKSEQPDEKMIRHGATVLTDAELLALLIRTGNREQSALDLCRTLLHNCGQDLNRLSKLNVLDLQRVKGIGRTKSVVLTAAFELARRKISIGSLNKTMVRSSKDVADFLKLHLSDLPYEVFAVVLLNRANRIIHFEVISKGGITGTVADPRIILKLALLHGATGIILSHNHPSGNLQPSQADDQVTRNIQKAAELMDIKLLDHLIVSDDGYYSYVDAGMLN
jgi:DNA repair protein RadC